MPFNPSTDVVLEVLNAADPARASMAAERLAALAAGAPARDFALDLDKAAASATATEPLPAGLANARTALADAAGGSDPAAKAKVDFEAMPLSSFVGEMLPKESQRLLRPGDVRRRLALDARRPDLEADREVRSAGIEPAAVRDPRPRRGRAALERGALGRGGRVRAQTSSPLPPQPASLDGAVLTALRRRA